MRFKKRLLTIILSICMILSLLPTTAFAETTSGQKELSTSQTTVKAGDTFDVSFTQLTTVDNLTGVQLKLSFVKEAFEVLSIKSTELDKGETDVSTPENANEKGTVSSIIMEKQGQPDMTIQAGTKILTITLKVKDNITPAKYPIKVKDYILASRDDAGPVDKTPANYTSSIDVEVQNSSSQTDITDTMKVEFTNKKMPYGDRYGKVPETKVTAGNDTLVEGTDYTVEGAGNYKWNQGWPYVGGQDCTVKISPVEGSKYTFTAKEYSFKTESNQDSLKIAYKDGQTLSKDYDGTPVAIEYNENAKLSKNDTDPLKIMTMTSTRASEGGQFVYVDGSGSANKIVWTFYTDEECTKKTTVENGAESEGGAPAKAGDYWVKASLAADNAKIWTAAESNALAFTINQLADWNVNVEKIADQTYTGAAIEPEVVVTDNTGKTLVKDTDYTVSYLNNINAGTATARVKSADGKSAKEVTFKINPIELTKDNVTVEAKDAQYNYGSAIKPEIAVKLNGNALSDGDYTATLKTTDKLVNAGKYTLTYEIKGKGNCSGTVEAETVLTIGKAPIGANVSFNGKKICDAGDESFTLADQTYIGKAITPALTLKDDWYGVKDLKEGTDYTVTYTNNTNVGTATVTIKPTESGNYFFEGYDEGTVIEAITGTFKIEDSYGILPAEEKINAIGKVTLDSATAINEARKAYDALDEEAKQYVSNYETLTNAEAALKELLDAEEAALADAIQKINDIGEVTLESEDAINAARTAYDALSDANKAKVTNYSVLTDAEAALKELWKNDNITCYVRAESDDGTILPLTKVTMNKHNVPSFSSYAIKNAPDQDKNYVTSLHILLQALTNRNMTAQLATIDIQSSGWINDMFGWGQDNLWCINGIDPPKMSCNYEAKDGETYVFYQAYGNWGAGFGYTGYGFFGEFGPGQYYTPHSAIETTEMTKEVGEAADFKYLYTSSMHTPQYGSCNNEDGAYTMVFVGKDGEETVTDEDYREDINVDKDGKFQVTFDKPGTYIVSARYYNSDNTRGASNAYCKVTVKDTYGVGDLIDKINNIGTVTLDSESAITEARTAYDKLPEEVKARVSNYDTLTAAEAALQSLKDQIKAVIDQIDAIGTVTLDSEDAILAARTDYNALSDAQKALVTNVDTLTAAEQRLEKLKGDAKAIADAEAVIDAIGDNVTLDSEDAIKAARAAYDGLSDENKEKVSNYKKLTKAEATLAQLKADQKAAADVDQKIAGIGDVTLDSKKAIEEARAAYDALTDVQKQQVTKLAILTKAEASYEELAKAEKAKAEEVEKKIDAIGKVSLTSEDAIKAARDAYAALHADFKGEVSNYADLQAAETKLSDLKMDKAAEEVEKKIDEIGKVSLDSEKAIKEARDAYNALPDAAKKKVNNYKTLTDAEKQLSDLKEAAKKDTTKKTGNTQKNAKGNSVKTGDTANMVLPLCIMFIAAAVAGFCVVTMIRRKKRS